MISDKILGGDESDDSSPSGNKCLGSDHSFSPVTTQK